MNDDTENALPKPLIHLKLDQFVTGPKGKHELFDEVTAAPAEAEVADSLTMALDDVFNRCLRLPGAGQDEQVKLSIPAVAKTDEDAQRFSMSIWVKCGPQEGGATLVSSVGSKCDWGLRAATRLEFVWSATDKSSDATGERWHKLVSPVPLQPDEWVHVAVSADGEKVTLFINGSKVSEQEAPNGIPILGDDTVVLGGFTAFEDDLSALQLRRKLSSPNDLLLHAHGDELAVFVSVSDGLRCYDAYTGYELGYQNVLDTEGSPLSSYAMASDPRNGHLVQATAIGLNCPGSTLLSSGRPPSKYGSVPGAKAPDFGKYAAWQGDARVAFKDVATNGQGVWVGTTDTHAYLFDEIDQACHEIDVSHVNPATGKAEPLEAKFVEYDHHGRCFLLADARTITPVTYERGRIGGMLGDDGQPYRLPFDADILEIATPQSPARRTDDVPKVMGFAVRLSEENENPVEFYGWERGGDGRGRGNPSPYRCEDGRPLTVHGRWSGMQFDRTGRHLALIADAKNIMFFDTHTISMSANNSGEVANIEHHATFTRVALSPDAKTVATLDEDDMLQIWDFEQVKKLASAPKCDLSGFRIYQEPLAQNEVEEAALTDLPAVQVGTVFPLDFSLHNNKQQQALFLTDEPQALFLEITNVGQAPVVFPSEADMETSGLAHADRSVMEIRFRPGTLLKDAPELDKEDHDPLDAHTIGLAPLTEKEITKSGHPDHTGDWEIKRGDDPDSNDVLRLVHKGAEDVAGRTLLTGQTQYIRLAGVRVNQAMGTHSSRVQLSYRLRHVDGSPVLGSRLHYLRIMEMSDADIVDHVKDLRHKTRDIDTIRGTGTANADLIKAIKHDLKLERDEDKALEELADALFFEHGGPLQASIIGVPAVVNDGVTKNHLTVRVKRRKYANDSVLLAPSPGKSSQFTLYLYHHGTPGWCLLDKGNLTDVDVSVLDNPAWTATHPDKSGQVTVTHTPPSASQPDSGDHLFDYVDIQLGFPCGSAPAEGHEDSAPAEGHEDSAPAAGQGSGQRNIVITYTGIGAYGKQSTDTGWLSVAVERTKFLPTQAGAIAAGPVSMVENTAIGFFGAAGVGGADEAHPDAAIFASDNKGSLHVASNGEIGLFPALDPAEARAVPEKRGFVVSQGAETPKGDAAAPPRPTTKAHLDGQLTATGGIDAVDAEITGGSMTIHGAVKVYGNVTPGGDPKQQIDPHDTQGSYLVPKGVIVMWHGAYKDIPHGWALCDGTNNTPNLQSHFIVGATGPKGHFSDLTAYKDGDTGGQEQVNLDSDQMPNHTHTGTTAKCDEAGTIQRDKNRKAIWDGEHGHTGQETSRADNDDNDCTTQNICVPGTNYYYDTKKGPFGSITSTGSAHQHGLAIEAAGKGMAHENRPPFVAVFFIIKL